MIHSDLNAVRSLNVSDAILDDVLVPLYVEDRRLRIAVVRVDGTVYAFDDLCTCGGRPCPLSGGLLTGTTLMCQCHGSEFDVTSGAVLAGPATKSLRHHQILGEGNLRNFQYLEDDGQLPGSTQVSWRTVAIGTLVLLVVRRLMRQRGGLA